jgi:flagellar basal body P-ring protein FlgI
MNTIQKTVVVTATLLIVCALSGCNLGGKDNTITDDADLGSTIGSLVNVLIPEPAPVEGYGIVAGLRNTGSAECPPPIRAYLKRYIQKQLASSGKPGSLDIDKYINSLETAVVLVEGIIPAIPSKNQYFDLKVTALPNTQTTSLESGTLFRTELKRPGSFGIATDVLADAEGPVFTDMISSASADPKVGFVLGGGKVFNENRIILTLQESNFRVANAIRNSLNGRFGVGTARAVLADRVEVMVPNYYKNRKQRFISMIQAIYMNQDVEAMQETIKTLVSKLIDSEDKIESEIALEAIGNQSLGYLNEPLNSPDERIRLHAARCMLNLGSDAGLAALRQMAMDTSSPNRLEALEAIVVGAKRADATSVARRLLRDKDFKIVLAAYKHLRQLGDISITQEFIGRNFYLEQIAQTELKVIYASRNGQPKIVLFGAPLRCNPNIFIESDNGDITLNTPPGGDHVTIMRKHPKRAGLVVRLNSSLNLGDIIKTLCEEPSGRHIQDRKGLGVTYAEVIALLKRMCDKGAIDAKFHAGELPKIDLNIKK